MFALPFLLFWLTLSVFLFVTTKNALTPKITVTIIPNKASLLNFNPPIIVHIGLIASACNGVKLN